MARQYSVSHCLTQNLYSAGSNASSRPMMSKLATPFSQPYFCCQLPSLPAVSLSSSNRRRITGLSLSPASASRLLARPSSTFQNRLRRCLFWGCSITSTHSNNSYIEKPPISFKLGPDDPFPRAECAVASSHWPSSDLTLQLHT